MAQSNDDELNKHDQMGIAALLRGMEYAREVLQNRIDEMHARLARLQGKATTNGRAGWSEDPEERRQEMARRVAARKKKTKSNAVSAARKREWGNMSPRKRKARLAAMLAGRARKAA